MGVVGWLDPHVDQYVLKSAGEQKVEEVHKHWIVMAWPAVRVAAGIFILVSAFAFEGFVYWVLFLLGMALGCRRYGESRGVPRSIRDHQPASIPS